MHTHNSFENLKPFVKWVGGKGSSVERLLQLIPEHIDTYVEPFVGSGALFFSLNFDKAIINDSNSELIAAYQEIKENVFELEMFLSTLIYDKSLYEKIRSWDREKDFFKRPRIERAARLIYLMKTCYNGLYRVSKKNYFNTPMGNYKSPLICDVPTLNACYKFLNDNNHPPLLQFSCCMYLYCIYLHFSNNSRWITHCHDIGRKFLCQYSTCSQQRISPHRANLSRN